MWGKTWVNLSAEMVARVCHDVNAAHSHAIAGAGSELPFWDDAPQWQRDSAINGVMFHRNNPLATPEDSHKNWLLEKIKDGWKYGPLKDEKEKKHPCIVPYETLPESQRAKDYIFRQIVHSLSTPPDAG